MPPDATLVAISATWRHNSATIWAAMPPGCGRNRRHVAEMCVAAAIDRRHSCRHQSAAHTPQPTVAGSATRHLVGGIIKAATNLRFVCQLVGRAAFISPPTRWRGRVCRPSCAANKRHYEGGIRPNSPVYRGIRTRPCGGGRITYGNTSCGGILTPGGSTLLAARELGRRHKMSAAAALAQQCCRADIRRHTLGLLAA